MISRKLVFSLAILVTLIAALIWRLDARAAAVQSAYPPIGTFVTVNGARVHYRQTGAGPDVILLHGASGNLREWEFGIRAGLSGVRVTAFDRPGHGYSDAIPGGDHLAAQAAHLRAAAATLGIDDFVLLGHSYGGSVSLAWALQDAPRALVLVCAPALQWPGALDPWYRLTNSRLGAALLVPLASALVPQSYVDAAIRSVFAPAPVPPAYLTEFGAALTLRADTLATNTAQVNALYDDITAQMGDYPSLALPIHLIHGDRDTIVPLAIHSAPLADLLPNAQLTVIAGAGHMPHHSHKDAVIAAIRQELP